MTIDTVWKNIEATANAFRSLIVTKNLHKTVDTISWENYSSGIFRNLYSKEYEGLVRKRQYSFLLKEDKGFIQLYYFFQQGELRKAKLAYYPYPVELNDAADIDAYLDDTTDKVLLEYYYDMWTLLNHQFRLEIDDERLAELIKQSKEKGNDETEEALLLGRLDAKYKCTNSSHIRIDYDSAVTTHHKCEIQVGALNNIRLPLKKIIMPFTFCDFIFKNVFKVKHADLVGKNNYPADFQVSKKASVLVNPFVEPNIFIDHI